MRRTLIGLAITFGLIDILLTTYYVTEIITGR